jgi:homocysteine S-methyltransferase
MSKHNLIGLWHEKKRPLVLDGANGCILQAKVKTHDLLWSSGLNMEDPESVIALHKQYIDSGAEIITTNTFRTNPHFYHKYKLKYSLREFVTAGVNLAKFARGDKSILIAGSNPPAEDCYQVKRTLSLNELENNHLSHINLLFESGVDFILNETQSHFDELKIICRHCSGNNIPFVISLFVTDKLRILSGESIKEVLDYLLPFNPTAIAFNCFHPETYKKLLEVIAPDMNTGFYFNCGSAEFTGEAVECRISPDEYIEQIKDFIAEKTVFVGSCCGSNPAHTQKIRAYLDEKN